MVAVCQKLSSLYKPTRCLLTPTPVHLNSSPVRERERERERALRNTSSISIPTATCRSRQEGPDVCLSLRNLPSDCGLAQWKAAVCFKSHTKHQLFLLQLLEQQTNCRSERPQDLSRGARCLMSRQRRPAAPFSLQQQQSIVKYSASRASGFSSLLQEEYRAEGITWHNIDYIDNSGCLNLISKKPTALFHLLDEECKYVNSARWLVKTI